MLDLSPDPKLVFVPDVQAQPGEQLSIQERNRRLDEEICEWTEYITADEFNESISDVLDAIAKQAFKLGIGRDTLIRKLTGSNLLQLQPRMRELVGPVVRDVYEGYKRVNPEKYIGTFLGEIWYLTRMDGELAVALNMHSLDKLMQDICLSIDFKTFLGILLKYQTSLQTEFGKLMDGNGKYPLGCTFDSAILQTMWTEAYEREQKKREAAQRVVEPKLASATEVRRLIKRTIDFVLLPPGNGSGTSGSPHKGRLVVMQAGREIASDWIKPHGVRGKAAIELVPFARDILLGIRSQMAATLKAAGVRLNGDREVLSVAGLLSHPGNWDRPSSERKPKKR